MQNYKFDITKIHNTLKVADVQVGFGIPSHNMDIVDELDEFLKENRNKLDGLFICITGPMSVHVAMVIAHNLAHNTRGIAVYDPKVSGYVVVITHDPMWQIGNVFPVDDDHQL